MIEILDASDRMINERQRLEQVREKYLHLACPALTGEPEGHAFQALQDVFDIPAFESYCARVNQAVDIGSLWPQRYVSLLPVPPYPKTPDWYAIFTDMFRVHYMKDQSYTILVLLDAGVYPDTVFIRKELVRAGMDYPAPRDRKKPFTYFHAED